jgi:hypothetical protein
MYFRLRKNYELTYVRRNDIFLQRGIDGFAVSAAALPGRFLPKLGPL